MSGPDRDELLNQATLLYPGFAVYQRRAQPRSIPLLELEFI